MGTPGIADYSDYIFVCVLPLLCYLYYSKLHNVIIILYYLFVILTGLAYFGCYFILPAYSKKKKQLMNHV